ncbi:MAG: response regulator transcription factor [Tardiphaga sp.]
MSFSKIVIADRYPIILEGLAKLIGEEHDFEVIARCTDGPSCIDALRSLAPDILIFDALMPGVTALEILSIINSEKLPTRLVLFIPSDEGDDLVMSGPAGTYSIIPKNISTPVLLQSLRHVVSKSQFLPTLSSRQGIQAQNAITGNALTALTERERQIVRLVSEGLSNKEVGRRLNITDGTIKVHLHNIFQKLEISNRTVLAALAISSDDRSSDSDERHVPSDPQE